MKSLFDIKVGTSTNHQLPQLQGDVGLPTHLDRKKDWSLATASELEIVRHYTKLSQQNFSIDTQFYPLGSCTMKYNPKVANRLAFLDGFTGLHPDTPDTAAQGMLHLLWDLQKHLEEITGMQEVSLAPMAGAQGELAGVYLIRAYHRQNKDFERNEIIIPAAAHGTNPASAIMSGFVVKEVPNLKNGDIDLEALESMLNDKTAAIMLTNPSTLGVFDRNITRIAEMVHDVGGLLYYDGANLNAILGKVRPGDMGFDVIHMNLHKTFATPHGGGGPGAGSIGVNKKLQPFLPIPKLKKEGDDIAWVHQDSESIGRMSGFYGNVGVLVRAYIYIISLGKQGLTRVSEYATLNANYLMAQLQAVGYTAAYPERRASHEFILTTKPQLTEQGVSAKDIAKRLLDYDVHAPTTYFPLIVPECLLIEPTETESKERLDEFVRIMADILTECQTNPDVILDAPHSMTHKRLDDVKAVKQLDIACLD